MTDSKHFDDGGMAYPGRSFSPNGYPEGHSMGMSVRDWFAGQALAGFSANTAIFAANSQNGWDLVNASARDLADRAYWLADAMIAARKGGMK